MEETACALERFRQKRGEVLRPESCKNKKTGRFRNSGKTRSAPGRWTVLCRAILILLSMALPAWADGPAIPRFWDSHERLPKPDLTSVRHIRFLTTTDFPPFNFLDKSGRLAGFNVDLARAICSELNILDKCQIQALPWNELSGALAKRQGDAIIAGIAVTPQSRETYVFSRPYIRFPARLIVTRHSAINEPVYSEITGKRIGVIAGSAHQHMFDAYFPNAVAVPYGDENGMRVDLKSGRLDGIFGDGMRLAFWLSGTDSAGCCRFAGGPYLSSRYLGEGMSIAVRPDDQALLAALDYALHEVGIKGVFSDLYLRYFPVSFY
jgi:polar amino acid transport system substrate-binding protein